MNLITDPWIPIVRADGTREKIAPWQIAEQQNPVMEIAAPRPDFQGALYQFLIGLLQTVAPPEDLRDWVEHWREPINIELLHDKFETVSGAFNLVGEGAAFMQDYDLENGDVREISALLIETSGSETHFVKDGIADSVCTACLGTVLFTLQLNAPPGGRGHRASLRRGGPLTTILMPERAQSLWQKLWINVFAEEEFLPPVQMPTAAVFPWLSVTRTSENESSSVFPTDKDISLLQMYWSMPRRIRVVPQCHQGHCGICGELAELFSHYQTKNYGIKYEGWVHKLTPYFYDKSKEEFPRSILGQKGKLAYKDWLCLVAVDEKTQERAAENVQSYIEQKSRYLSDDQNIGLWCFGYDMDNMKARCWYEHHLPVISVDQEYREVFFSFVGDLIASAKDAVKELRSQIKAAWFSRPKDAKGDTSMIDQSFWQATEADFYQQLHRLAQLPADTRAMPATVAQEWLQTLRRKCLDLFDHWSLEGEAEDMDLKRVVKARRFLDTNLNKAKSIKKLHDIAKSTKEVA